MMTVKQVSLLTGVSVRTLQFYDEIGLLKPAGLTDAGYRLYDDAALQRLQKILFFKQLDFSLKEIREILNRPGFDATAMLKKQQSLLTAKRDRLNALLLHLETLISGEPGTEETAFGLQEYFRILDEFKLEHSEEICARLGSMEAFEEMVSFLKSKAADLAPMAVSAYGSLENYTTAMKKNLLAFLSEGSPWSAGEVEERIQTTEELTQRLTAHLGNDPASLEVQELLEELISFVNESNEGTDMGEGYWPSMAELYLTSPVYIEVNDRKYGEGASFFLGHAIKAYLERLRT